MCKKCTHLVFSLLATFFTVWFLLDAIRFNILRWGIWGYSLAIFVLLMIAMFSCPIMNKKFVCDSKKNIKKKKLVKKKK